MEEQGENRSLVRKIIAQHIALSGTILHVTIDLFIYTPLHHYFNISSFHSIFHHEIKKLKIFLKQNGHPTKIFRPLCTKVSRQNLILRPNFLLLQNFHFHWFYHALENMVSKIVNKLKNCYLQHFHTFKFALSSNQSAACPTFFDSKTSCHLGFDPMLCIHLRADAARHRMLVKHSRLLHTRASEHMGTSAYTGIECSHSA